MADDKRRDAAVENLARKAGVVQRVLSTADGQELLEIMRAEFLGSLRGRDATEITFRAGQADVVAWFMQMQKFTYERR